MKKVLLIINVMFISTNVFGMKMQTYILDSGSYKGLKRIESTQNLRGKYEQSFFKSEKNRSARGLTSARAENISSVSKQRVNVSINGLNNYLNQIYQQNQRSFENIAVQYDSFSQTFDSEERKKLQFLEEQLYAALRSIKSCDIESLKKALNYLDTSYYGQLLLFACQYRCLIRRMPSFTISKKLREAEMSKEQMIEDLFHKMQKGISREIILEYQIENKKISNQISRYNSLNHLSNKYLSSERKAKDLQENFRIINLLFSHPDVDTQVRNKHGKTAFDVLIEAQDFDTVKKLQNRKFRDANNSLNLKPRYVPDLTQQELEQPSFTKTGHRSKTRKVYNTLKQFLKIRKDFH